MPIKDKTMVTCFFFSSMNYSFRNTNFIKECFNTFVNEPFTVAIFYKNVFYKFLFWNLGMSEHLVKLWKVIVETRLDLHFWDM